MTTPRKNVALSASVVAMALMLGGCQALGLGGNRMARTSIDAELAANPVDMGAAQLDAGRRALAAGNTVDAIDAFMRAKASPEHMPAAYNGLAVAYSRVGRTDLSERFFLTAVALAPEEDRFRANLALFYTRNGQPKIAEPALAIAPVTAPETTQVAAAAPSSAPVIRNLGAGVTVQAPTTRLQRVSRGEVAIRSGGLTAPVVKTASVTRRPVIEVGGSREQAYPVRVTLANSAEQPRKPQAYPIRIPLGD
ncbi:tetratricopeptide repeat protein [Tsuneonella sp. HG249]